MDCGARLPSPVADGGESVVPPAAHQPPPPVFKGARKEYAALKTVAPRRTLRNFCIVLALVVGALAGWAVSLAMKPVQVATPSVVPNAAIADQFVESLAKSATSRRANWVGPVASFNQLLATKAPPRLLTTIAGTAVQFERCHIEPREGVLDLVMLLDVGGRQIVCRLALVPIEKDGGTGIRVAGASIGSLTIPQVLAQYLAPIWSPCVENSRSFLERIASANRVEVTPRALIVQWSASSR